MHPVSLFPHLFDYQMLGVFMIRATLGLIFVHFAYEKILRAQKERVEFFEELKLRPAKVFFWATTLVELVAGIGLTIGLYTQLAATITGSLMALASLMKKHRPPILPHNTVAFYILLAITSFSILLLGPGSFAFDLPL